MVLEDEAQHLAAKIQYLGCLRLDSHALGHRGRACSRKPPGAVDLNCAEPARPARFEQRVITETRDMNPRLVRRFHDGPARLYLHLLIIDPQLDRIHPHLNSKKKKFEAVLPYPATAPDTV